MRIAGADLEDWERQRAFLAVVREGSLSGAARVLRVAQPTVRRRIEDLERQYGVALFTRAPTGLIPTPIGLELQAHAEAMANAAASFRRAASAEAGSASGTVRIAASEVVGVEVLPPLLAELRRAHPGLALELGLGNRSEDLLGREADVAVRMVRPQQSALVARPIGAIRLGLFAHRRYLEEHGKPSDMEDLRRFAIIGFETETIGVRTLRAMGLSLQPDDFAFRTDSDLGQLAAIRAGLGIGVCQVGLGRRDPALVHLLPEQFRLGFDTWIVTHEDLRRVQRVSLVFEALAEGLASYVRGQ